MAPRTATLKNLLDERMMELAWEGWRRQDMIRFGVFTRSYSCRPQLPGEENGYTTVFPIPEKVIDMNLSCTSTRDIKCIFALSIWQNSHFVIVIYYLPFDIKKYFSNSMGKYSFSPLFI